MKHRFIRLLVFAVMLGSSSSVMARELLLVSSFQEPINAFSKTELRRLFLGFTVKRNGVTLTSSRNTSEEYAYQVFLQHVMFMSKRNYERRLLSLGFTKGNKIVPEYNDILVLLKEINKNNNHVSYVWREDIKPGSDLNVIQVLWEGK